MSYLMLFKSNDFLKKLANRKCYYRVTFKSKYFKFFPHAHDNNYYYVTIFIPDYRYYSGREYIFVGKNEYIIILG